MSHAGRRILVFRHGERCDYFFRKRGIDWLKEAFGDGKHYCRFDPEMPEDLPARNGRVEDYFDDCPLTSRGFQMAVDAGCFLKERGITIDFLYVSPSLRCIQTAVGILKGLGDEKLQLFVEPGLFQWLRWCKNGVPKFMGIIELAEAGFPVSRIYKPLFDAQRFNLHETLEEYFERSYALIKCILERHFQGTICCIAHAGSLNTLTQQLCGRDPLSLDDFSCFLDGTSYLSCEEIQEQEDMAWKSVGSPIPKLSNSGLDRC